MTLILVILDIVDPDASDFIDFSEYENDYSVGDSSKAVVNETLCVFVVIGDVLVENGEANEGRDDQTQAKNDQQQFELVKIPGSDSRDYRTESRRSLLKSDEWNSDQRIRFGALRSV